MQLVLTVFRYLVFAGVAVIVVGAALAMAVQRRALNPFGTSARTIRRFTDPFLKPVERRVLRSGGNPQSAPWWVIGVTVLAGILLVSAVDWSVAQGRMVMVASQGGPRSIVRLVVDGALWLLTISLFVRVIGSWFGVGDHARWMRPFYLMTEWFLAPLRRVLPRFGPLDLSPLVAWLLIGYVVRPIIHSVL